MRGVRLLTPTGEMVVWPKRWIEHSAFLVTALEYDSGEDEVLQIPVCLPADVLNDLVQWCQYLSIALEPYRAYNDGDDDENLADAASVAWKAYVRQHELHSVPASITLGQQIDAVVATANDDVQAPPVVDAQPVRSGSLTLSAVLESGDSLAPLFRLISAADHLEVKSFFWVAFDCMQELVQALGADDIRARFGDEPAFPGGLFEEWCKRLDQATLSEAGRVSPFWRAATQNLLLPPRAPIPYHTSCNKPGGALGNLFGRGGTLVRILGVSGRERARRAGGR